MRLLPASKQRYEARQIYLIASILIAFLLVDSVLNYIPDFAADFLASAGGFALFICVTAAYGMGWYFILKFIKQSSESLRAKVRMFNWMHAAVRVIQYILLAIIIGVILQMVVLSHYYTAMLTVATSISLGLSGMVMILLAQRFVLWYVSRRNFVVLLYGLSAIGLAVNAVAAIALMDYILVGKPAEVSADSPIVFPSYDPGSIEKMLSDAYFEPAIVSTLLIWIATALLLRHYFRENTIKYWIIVSLPLAYFLGQFADLILPLFGLPDISGEFSYLIFAALNTTAIGFLFGVAFWAIARSIQQGSVVRDYMNITAYGFVLFFISSQASMMPTPYAPFGLASVSSMGMASYLILVGLYSSAVSMSQDINLRVSIRKTAKDQLRLLDSIGSAQMEQKVKSEILQITKDHQAELTEEVGVQSSMSEEEIKLYLDEILKEVKRTR